MVLSLGFILAFIGAAVALLIGILIFSEVSDAIICPAGASPGGPGSDPITGFNNIGTFGDSADAFYINDGSLDSFVTTTGIIGQGVIQNGTSSGGGATQGQIEFGSVPSTWNFIHSSAVGLNQTSINFWINGDVDGSSIYPLLDDANTQGNPGFRSLTSGNSIALEIYEDQFDQIDISFITGIPADDSNWHMITFVMDKGNTTGSWIFKCIDAVCAAGDAQFDGFTGVVVNPNRNMTIGSNHGAGSVIENTFDVDDVTIWNGWILSQSEIDTMYNSGAGSTGRSIATGTQVLHVSFDVGSELVMGGASPTPGVGGQGSEECENAKDTAWTVIGILPVALFFALFAIFGALGRTS